MADALLDQLLGPVAIAPRGSGVAAVVRDLWLGGMPLPQAAAPSASMSPRPGGGRRSRAGPARTGRGRPPLHRNARSASG
jgi:hypothetical protein